MNKIRWEEGKQESCKNGHFDGENVYETKEGAKTIK